MKEYQVETIVDSLCSNMISEKEQLRDISSIGLKTVISELPLTSSSLASSVCRRITGKLSNAIEKVYLLLHLLFVHLFLELVHQVFILASFCGCSRRMYLFS